LLGQPLLLFPMHVMLMELVIDPTCALVFEAERSEAKAMQRPPRRKDEPLFGVAQIKAAILQGALLLVAVLALYGWALTVYSEEESRGGAFIALVLGNLALALTDSMASGGMFAHHRLVFWAISTAVALILGLVFLVPEISEAFAVALPDVRLFALALATPLVVGLCAAFIRAWRERPAQLTAA
jgi:Ca2+-transporting ATPase